MKKLFVLMMVAMLLIPTAVQACSGEAVLPNIETPACAEEAECVWVVLSQETQQLFGKMFPNENLPVYPVQSVEGKCVRGIYEHGLWRFKGEMKYLLVDGMVCGLTKVRANVWIDEIYTEAVRKIITRRMGEGCEITAQNVIACTIGRTEETVYHYMFHRDADKIPIGRVLFSGASTEAVIYMGDWTGDGELELGFAISAGTVCPEAEPETHDEPAPQETQPSESSDRNSCKKTKCGVTNIQINFGVVFNWFQQVFKGGCCKK